MRTTAVSYFIFGDPVTLSLDQRVTAFWAKCVLAVVIWYIANIDVLQSFLEADLPGKLERC